MKRPHVVLAIALCVLVTRLASAQVPEDVAKSSADLAARQAEAILKAQMKVAEEAARAAEARAREITPIEVEVVMSRYQGDKKVSSLPYVLTVNAAEHQPETRLRMGANVPVPSMAPPVGPDGKPIALPGPAPFNYQDLTTQIDAKARSLGDGRFELFISVADRALATSQEATGAVANVPVIRSFQTSNSIVLRDGQTRQFTAAADRITGEVVRVDVTLRVVK